MRVWVVYSDYAGGIRYYGVGSAEDRTIEAIFHREDDARQFVDRRMRSPSAYSRGGDYHYEYESHLVEGEPVSESETER